MTCPLPRKNQIITTAGHRLECEGESTVIAAMPMSDRHTGQFQGFQLAKVCFDHAIDIAVWKLINMPCELDHSH